MKLEEVFRYTFKALRREIGPSRFDPDLVMPSMKMIDACRADDFSFFQPFIAAGRLTIGNMHHACSRYYMGKTKSGIPIYWMVDEMLQPLDAHIGDTWISYMLKQREPLLEYWRPKHCLFGLHLIYQHKLPIAIVEQESSAVILSELFPDNIWLAYATTMHLQPDLLAPLDGRDVTIYPRTDPAMNNYMFFLDYRDIIRRLYPGINLRIDTTLENHTTAEQKERCVDLLEFLADSIENSATLRPE